MFTQGVLIPMDELIWRNRQKIAKIANFVKFAKIANVHPRGVYRELKQPRRRTGGRRPEVKWRSLRKREPRISSSCCRRRLEKELFHVVVIFRTSKPFISLKGACFLSFFKVYGRLEFLFASSGDLNVPVHFS